MWSSGVAGRRRTATYMPDKTSCSRHLASRVASLEAGQRERRAGTRRIGRELASEQRATSACGVARCRPDRGGGKRGVAFPPGPGVGRSAEGSDNAYSRKPSAMQLRDFVRAMIHCASASERFRANGWNVARAEQQMIAAARKFAQDPNKHVGIDEDSRPASAYHDSPVAKALGGIWLDFRKPLGNIQFIVDNYGFHYPQEAPHRCVGHVRKDDRDRTGILRRGLTALYSRRLSSRPKFSNRDHVIRSQSANWRHYINFLGSCAGQSLRLPTERPRGSRSLDCCRLG
jgi:hypothetical protein